MTLELDGHALCSCCTGQEDWRSETEIKKKERFCLSLQGKFGKFCSHIRYNFQGHGNRPPPPYYLLSRTHHSDVSNAEPHTVTMVRIYRSLGVTFNNNANARGIGETVRHPCKRLSITRFLNCITLQIHSPLEGNDTMFQPTHSKRLKNEFVQDKILESQG